VTQSKPGTCPEGAQVELKRERCVPKVLKLSSEVSQCKPLARGESTNENFNIRSELTRAAVKIQAHYRGYQAEAYTRPPFSST
jgi:hypothetical protein